MKKLKNNQKAFTIIELLIASTVFSMIILGACVAIIQMSRLYYKGIILSRTQTAGRNLTEAIAREIQFQGGTVGQTTSTPLPPDPKTSIISIGDTRYKFAINQQQGKDITHAIVKYNYVPTDPDGPDLDNTALGSSTYRDILGNNMRVLDIRVSEISGGGVSTAGLYSIQVVIAYGESDLLDIPADLADTTCKGNLAGSQWCSVVRYNTMVYQRK